MAYNLEPRTIKENLLGLIGKNPHAEPRPASTREECFLADIAENGGGLPEVTAADNGDVLAVVGGAWAKAPAPSSLPPYTSADKGKVLTVGEGSESVQTVIVPEQSVTLEEGGFGVWVKLFAEGSGVDFSFFENAKEGDTAVFTLNGTNVDSVATTVSGAVLFPVGDYYVGYASMFEGTGVASLSEPTVKTLTISGYSIKPKTVAKWGTPVFVLEKNFGTSTVGESEEDYNALMSAYNEGAILLLKNTASNVSALTNVGAAFYINYDSENNVFTANIAWLEDGSVVYLAFGTYTIDPTATTNTKTKTCSVQLSRA